MTRHLWTPAVLYVRNINSDFSQLFITEEIPFRNGAGFPFEIGSSYRYHCMHPHHCTNPVICDISFTLEAREILGLVTRGDITFKGKNLVSMAWHEGFLQSGQDTLPDMKVSVITNSYYVMNEMLANTDLANISSAYLSHEEKALGHRGIALCKGKQMVHFGAVFLCLSHPAVIINLCHFTHMIQPQNFLIIRQKCHLFISLINRSIHVHQLL